MSTKVINYLLENGTPIEKIVASLRTDAELIESIKNDPKFPQSVTLNNRIATLTTILYVIKSERELREEIAASLRRFLLKCENLEANNAQALAHLATLCTFLNDAIIDDFKAPHRDKVTQDAFKYLLDGLDNNYLNADRKREANNGGN